MAATWLTTALASITELPTLEEGFAHFAQILHNEMVSGKGMTNPVGVTLDIVEAAGELAAALKPSTSAAAPPQSPSSPPPPVPSNTGIVPQASASPHPPQQQ